MNLHIQWLKLVYILILMPGIFIFPLKKILRRMSTGSIYLLIMLVYQLAISFILKNYTNIYILVGLIIGVIIPLILEMYFNQGRYILRKIKQIILINSSVFVFPILEELQYRWGIYELGMLIHENQIEFVLISSLAFTVSHIPYLGIKGFSKVFQGIILGIIFVKFNICMCILCHLMFNVFVNIRNERRG